MGTQDLYPDAMARFYDVIYQSLRHDLDSAFYMKKIIESKGPVLEAGSGTGRFFTEALKQGADMYGMDVSENMLRVLRGKLPAEAHFRISCQDLCTFTHPQQFPLIIAPFRVMMHLTKPELQLQALNNAAKHLTDDGIFIFDAFVPSLHILLHGLPPTVDFEGEYEPGRKLRRTSSARPELISQLNHITMLFEWEEKDGWVSEIWHTDLYLYFRTELEHLVARSALRIDQFLGSFEGNELSADSKEFILICKKK